VRVIAATRPGARVDASGPQRGGPRVIGEGGDGLAQALVAGPAKNHGPVFAGGAGDRGGPGLGRELLGGGEAAAVIAQLGQKRRGGALATPGPALPEWAVRRVGQGRDDRGGEWLALSDQRAQHRDQGAPELATGVALRLAGAADRGATQAAEPLGRGAAPPVGLTAEKLGPATVAQPLGALGRGVTGQKRQGEEGIDVGEDPRGAGPEALEHGAQLMGEGHALGDEVIAAADEGAHGAGVVGERLERAEAMAIGAAQVGEERTVAAIALGMGGRGAGAGSLHPSGMDRPHPDVGLQQGIDARALREAQHQLDGDALSLPGHARGVWLRPCLDSLVRNP
jgi:hypothetical protein